MIDKNKNIPYPGFRAFSTKESFLFFGREGLTDEIISRLSSHKFVAVTGVSGSGKSSLVKAGLVPDLRKGLLGNAGLKWIDVQFSPGEDPINNLVKALTDKLPIAKGADVPFFAKSTVTSRLEGICDYYEASESTNNLLIVVDQFEELFRFEKLLGKESHDKALFFVELLLRAIESSYPIYIVITMRSDFLGRCAGFPKLLDFINRSQYLVPRLSRQELRRAIEEPAKIEGAQFSPALISSILNDVIDSQDQLPQLQHSLRLTWLAFRNDTLAENLIKQKHYDSVGGMVESLGRHAENLYEQLDEQQKNIAEDIFKTITELGAEHRAVRKPTSLKSLSKITSYDGDQLRGVIDIFRKEGENFLQPFGDAALVDSSMIDISHESLINSWTRLKRWVEQEAKLVNKLQVIKSKVELWKHQQGELLIGLDLDLGKRLIEKKKFNEHWIGHVVSLEANEENLDVQLSDNIKDYVSQSVHNDQEERRVLNLHEKTKKIRSGIYIAVLIIILALIVFLSFSKVSQDKLDSAEAKLDSAEAKLDSAEQKLSNAKLEAKLAESSAEILQREKVEQEGELGRQRERNIRLNNEINQTRRRSELLEITHETVLKRLLNQNREAASTNTYVLNKANKFESDLWKLTFLNAAFSELEKENYEKAFRLSQYILDKIENNNLKAESFILECFYSGYLGPLRSRFLDSYIITLDEGNEKLKVISTDTKEIKYQVSINGMVISPQEKFILLKKRSKIMLYDLKSNILYDSILTELAGNLRLYFTKGDSSLFMHDDQHFVFYDLVNHQLYNIPEYLRHFILHFDGTNLYYRSRKKFYRYDVRSSVSHRIKKDTYWTNFFDTGAERIFYEVNRKISDTQLDSLQVGEIINLVDKKKIFGEIEPLSTDEINTIKSVSSF